MARGADSSMCSIHRDGELYATKSFSEFPSTSGQLKRADGSGGLQYTVKVIDSASLCMGVVFCPCTCGVSCVYCGVVEALMGGLDTGCVDSARVEVLSLDGATKHPPVRWRKDDNAFRCTFADMDAESRLDLLLMMAARASAVHCTYRPPPDQMGSLSRMGSSGSLSVSDRR